MTSYSKAVQPLFASMALMLTMFLKIACAVAADPSADAVKPSWPATGVNTRVTISLFEACGSHSEFPAALPAESFRFTTPMLALHRLPLKYVSGGVREVWNGPVLMQAFVKTVLPEGGVDLLIRSPGRARLWIDGQIVATTPARRLFPDAHQPFEVYQPDMPWLRVPHVGDHEVRVRFESTGQPVEVVLESLVGSASSRCELGETLVAFRQADRMFTLIQPIETLQAVRPPSVRPPSVSNHDGPQRAVHLVDSEFEGYRAELESYLQSIDRQSLIDESARENAFWDRRHEIARNYLAGQPDIVIPEKHSALSESNLIDRLVNDPLKSVDAASIDHATNDLEFLRRLSLDTVGMPPSPTEIDDYLADVELGTHRELAIVRFVSDERWADHWVSYWQDVLAENPNILKPKLNNTGPFRGWLYDSLVLNKPMDRFATELIRMEGSAFAGAAGGFSWATENDVPMAEKAHIIAGAFQSVNMKCARCHDAPYHPWTQKDLFSLAAMLENQTITVPDTSSVPRAFFDRKEGDSPIAITLQPGDIVPPVWPSERLDCQMFGPHEVDASLLGRDPTSRETLAAIITRAENNRFAATLVNRLWTRLMGWGLMPDTDDWYESESRNSILLDYLSRELIGSGYDLKHVAGMIMKSSAYQRAAIDEKQVERALTFAAPWRRRLSAEQVVDSLHHVTGMAMDTEPITFDPEASQKIENFLNLGQASRAWQLTSLSNERDRPSLSLPKAATLVECMEAFGWRQSRQSPITHREYEANVVQPGVVANGTLTGTVTRLTDASAITSLALASQSVESFIEQLFLRVLTRQPSASERAAFLAHLSEGFEDRELTASPTEKVPPVSRGFATWSNHFAVEANALMRDIELEVAAGPEPTQRLSSDWRERAEDAVWAIVNSPEFQFVP